jgi:hypothetical protein
VENPQNYVGKTDDSPYKKYIEEYEEKDSILYLKIALLPILGLYVLGWSYAWVRKGFSIKSKEYVQNK